MTRYIFFFFGSTPSSISPPWRLLSDDLPSKAEALLGIFGKNRKQNPRCGENHGEPSTALWGGCWMSHLGVSLTNQRDCFRAWRSGFISVPRDRHDYFRSKSFFFLVKLCSTVQRSTLPLVCCKRNVFQPHVDELPASLPEQMHLGAPPGVRSRWAGVLHPAYTT